MKFNKQKVMKVLPFVILGYAFNKVSQAFTSAAGTELGDKIMNGMDSLGEVFLNPLPSFNPIDILIGIAGGVIIKLAIYIKGKDAKKYRKGCEYGSARWGNGTWILAPEYENCGYVRTDKRPTFYGEGFFIHTRWTHKGAAFLYNRLKENGILPVFDWIKQITITN